MAAGAAEAREVKRARAVEMVKAFMLEGRMNTGNVRIDSGLGRLS